MQNRIARPVPRNQKGFTMLAKFISDRRTRRLLPVCKLIFGPCFEARNLVNDINKKLVPLANAQEDALLPHEFISIIDDPFIIPKLIADILWTADII